MSRPGPEIVRQGSFFPDPADEPPPPPKRVSGRLSIYLAGSITGLGEEESISWREKFRSDYGDAFEVHIPQERDATIESLSGKARWDAISQGERQDILNCNAIIAYFDRPSMGTAMGILYAYLSGRTVVVVTEMPATELSPMVLSHAHLVCASFQEAVTFIRERHSRCSVSAIRTRDGESEPWDESQIEKAIADAIALMQADGGANIQEPPKADKLADAVVMQIEDLLESGDLDRALLKTETIEQLTEKVFMSNAHRDEVLTLAKTYIRYRERRRTKFEFDQRNEDAFDRIKGFLHHFRGPIGNISRACDELSELPEEGQSEREALHEARKWGEVIAINKGAINDRVEQQKTEAQERYRTETINLARFVSAETTAGDGVEFCFEIDADLHVETRPHGLRTVLQNLIDNSIKHGFHGHAGVVGLRAVAQRESGVVLEFWNDGKPLKREDAEFLFHRPPETDRSGWRFGLSQVRRTIEEMGGHITCTPYRQVQGPDGRTHFEDADEGPPLFRIDLGDVRREAPPARRILVADDSDPDRENVERLLTRAGYEVVLAATIDEALGAIEAGGLYGAVLDVDFGEARDGIWLLSHLRARDPTVKTVVVSGSSSGQTEGNWRTRAEEAGARKMLNKESYRKHDLLSGFKA